MCVCVCVCVFRFEARQVRPVIRGKAAPGSRQRRPSADQAQTSRRGGADQAQTKRRPSADQPETMQPVLQWSKQIVAQGRLVTVLEKPRKHRSMAILK